MIQVKWKHWNGVWLTKEFEGYDMVYYSFIWMCSYCGYQYKLVQNG